MTLREKYKSLGDPNSLKEMVVTSVYNTMDMEGQTVPMEKVEELYNEVRKERQKQKGSLQKN